MGKPTPPIHAIRQTDKYVVEIIGTEGRFCVCYDGLDFSEVRRWPNGCRKYKSMVFGNEYTALIAARKLNEEFSTAKFTVHPMTTGEAISLEKQKKSPKGPK